MIHCHDPVVPLREGISHGSVGGCMCVRVCVHVHVCTHLCGLIQLSILSVMGRLFHCGHLWEDEVAATKLRVLVM